MTNRTLAKSESALDARVAHRVGRVLLLSLVSGALLIALVLKFLGEAERSAYFIPLALAVAAMCALALRGTKRAGIAVFLCAMAPIPWLGDIFTGWTARQAVRRDFEARKQYSERNGYAFDGRSVKQVIEDRRKDGKDTWPAVHPATLISEQGGVAASVVRGEDGKELQTLGGISLADTIGANEDGRYMTYTADEHGFHNPPGVWNLPQLDIAAIGDSFTQGQSVPSEANFVASVRRRWPKTLNLGYSGNGPLLETAAMIEYLPQRKPKVVLWFLCEDNDVGEDLERELPSPLLRKYRKERSKLQNLEARQSEIDKQLRAYVERVRLKPEVQATNWRSLLGLERLRQTAYALARPAPDRWDVFQQILGEARDTVKGWDGKLYLVYLPSHFNVRETWLRSRQRGTPQQRHERVLNIARDLNIPSIDIEPVFANAGPKLETFIYPHRGHFTAAGYAEVGRAVVERLEKDGW